MTDDNFLKRLTPGSKFLAVGSQPKSLETSLRRETIPTSSVLHPLKTRAHMIAETFNDPYIKRAVRTGGLTAMQQKKVVSKIVHQDKSLATNYVVKKKIKQLVHHFGKDQIASNKKMMIQRGREMELEPSRGATTINQITGQHAKSTIVKNETYGSVSQQMHDHPGDQPGINHTPLSSASSLGHLPTPPLTHPTLVV